MRGNGAPPPAHFREGADGVAFTLRPLPARTCRRLSEIRRTLLVPVLAFDAFIISASRALVKLRMLYARPGRAQMDPSAIFRSLAWSRCIAPRTSSRVSPKPLPIARHVSPALARSSMILVSRSTFVSFLAIQITSCRSFYSTTGGLFFHCLFIGIQSTKA